MNRRQALIGMGAVATLGATPVAGAMLINNRQSDRRAWDAAFAHMERTKRLADALGEKWDRLAEAREAAMPSSDHIDFREFAFLSKQEVLHSYDLDRHELWQQAGEGRVWWAKDPDAFRAKVRAACDAVRQWRCDRDALDERLDFARISQQQEDASEAYSDALSVLVEMPAPDSEALLWKIRYLFTSADTAWVEEYTAQFHRDAKRLLSTGRA